MLQTVIATLQRDSAGLVCVCVTDRQSRYSVTVPALCVCMLQTVIATLQRDSASLVCVCVTDRYSHATA